MEAEEFWNKVKIRLTETDHNQQWLCSRIGMALQSFRNKIHRNSMPSVELSMKIIEILGLTWDEFVVYPEVRKPLSQELSVIPVYEQYFSAGHGQLLSDRDEVKAYISVPEELKKLGINNLAATTVRGDSMEPTLYGGDTIICDTLGYDGKEGVYIIIYKGSGFVKRILVMGNEVNIISDNKLYPVMKEPCDSEDFKIIGKVRYVLHKL